MSEAEEKISEVEEKIVEITSEDKNIKKRTDNSLRNLGDNIKHTNIRIIGVPEEEEKNKGYEKKFLRNYSWKLPQHGKGNSQSSRGTKSPIQYEPKEKHVKTHTNQTNKDWTLKKES